MAEAARNVIQHLDRLELQADREEWRRWAGTLTTHERQRIVSGDYRAIKRPFPPSFPIGEWLPVSPGLAIRFGSVEARRGGRYLCIIDSVRDWRSGASPIRGVSESTDTWETTAAPTVARAPEPAGVDHADIVDLQATREARERWEQIKAEQRATHEAQPLAERVRRLEALGSPKARRQLRAIRSQLREGERRAGLRDAS